MIIIKLPNLEQTNLVGTPSNNIFEIVLLQLSLDNMYGICVISSKLDRCSKLGSFTAKIYAIILAILSVIFFQRKKFVGHFPLKYASESFDKIILWSIVNSDFYMK